jgi:hypothetical protein
MASRGGRSRRRFDAIPLARHADAFASNEQGWEAQLTLIAKYVVG